MVGLVPELGGLLEDITAGPCRRAIPDFGRFRESECPARETPVLPNRFTNARLAGAFNRVPRGVSGARWFGPLNEQHVRPPESAELGVELSAVDRSSGRLREFCRRTLDVTRCTRGTRHGAQSLLEFNHYIFRGRDPNLGDVQE